MHPDLGVSTRC